MTAARVGDHARARWALSFATAVVCTVLFLTLAIQTESPVDVLVPPLLQLDYVVLPPEPTVERPRPPRPAEKPVMKPKDVPVAPPPPAEAPVEAPRQPPAAPDMASVAEPKLERPKLYIVKNPSELDNDNYSPISRVQPEYPWVAREDDIEGYVDVELTVDEYGKVESYVLRKTVGHPLFAKETAKVLPKWRFPPPRHQGNKVKVRYASRVEFRFD